MGGFSPAQSGTILIRAWRAMILIEAGCVPRVDVWMIAQASRGETTLIVKGTPSALRSDNQKLRSDWRLAQEGLT